MKPRFIQANCNEKEAVDPRQSRVISRYKPDIVLFEYPAVHGKQASPFNRYPANRKPWKQIAAIQRELGKASQQYLYAQSDILTWANIETLWRNGKNTLLFNIDAPDDLRREYHTHFGHIPFSTAVRRWQFWAYLYLREYYMSRYTRDILSRHTTRKQLTVAVFLQSTHWKHVKFWLKNPPQKALWEYYFAGFPNLTPEKILLDLGDDSPLFLKYWKRIGIHP